MLESVVRCLTSGDGYERRITDYHMFLQVNMHKIHKYASSILQRFGREEQWNIDAGRPTRFHVFVRLFVL